jgi:SLT domain-containing protein/phage-related protein
MADGFKLGAAYIQVNPDTTGFKDKLNTDLDKDKTTVKVKVEPDATDFKKKLDIALAKAKGDKVTVKAEADTTDFTTKLDAATRNRTTTVNIKYNKSQVSKEGTELGQDFTRGFNGGVNGASGGGGAGGAGGGGGLGGGLAGGGIAAGITAALSVLPAAMAALGSVAGIGLGTAYLLETNKTVQTGAKTLVSGLEKTMKAATEPMVKPLLTAFSSIDKFFQSEKGPLTSFFGTAAKSVLPLTNALEKIVGSVLPAFTSLLKSSQPSLEAFYGVLGNLGEDIGKFLTNLGPGAKASFGVLDDLLGNLGDLLAFIGAQASSVANTFGGSIMSAFDSLTVLLETVVKWMAQLGGSLMPLISTLGGAFSSIINAAMPIIMPLLNQLIGIIDKLIVMLTPFIVQLINGLRPMLPIVMQLVSAFASFGLTILGEVTSALEPLIPILSQIIVDLLKPLAALLEGALGQNTKMFGQLIKALEPSLIQMAQSFLKLVVQMTPLLTLLVKGILYLTEFQLTIDAHVIPILADFIKYITDLSGWIDEGIGWFAKWSASGKNWQKTWATVVNWLHSTWSAMTNDIHKYWSDAINFITSTWSQISNNTHNWWADIVNWLHKTWSTSVSTLHSVWSAAVNWLRGLWNTAYNDVKGVWTDIANWFRNRWDADISLMKSLWNSARGWLKSLWGGFENDAKAIWTDIHNWFTGFWDREIQGWKNIINNVRSWIKGAWGDIKNDAVSAWTSISSGIAKAFTGVENGVKSPIEWMLKAIDRFDGLINKIPGVKLPTNLSFAGGGVLAGYAPGVDSVSAKLSPGESVLVPELTAKLGPANILRANYEASGRTPTIGAGNYAGGGWNPITAVLNAGKTVGSDISGAAKSAVKTVGNLWSDTTGLIANPVNWISQHATSMLTSGIGSGTVGSDVAHSAATSAVNAIKSMVSKSMTVNDVNYKAGAGVEQWKSDVLKALTLNGLGAALANQVLFQMQTESGGNPNAINLTDSNAAAGDPSRGLMQVIATTFSAFHVPGTSENILDPVANIAAALNYAKHTYGPTLERGGMGIGSGHGYARGGNAPAGDTAWVGETGPELVKFGAAARVIPNSQATGGVHFHEGAIVVNGRMSTQDVERLKQQLTTAVSGYNV